MFVSFRQVNRLRRGVTSRYDLLTCACASVRTLSRADVEENDLVALLLLVVNTVDVVGEIESLNGESCLFLLPYLKNVISNLPFSYSRNS